mmetsp:Transcript_130730/g.406509  ORF Transcript_130730/g.406509 Transcript_130730/m.406509 type:complete len:233 (+) Transcript_130730:702-1400(+)
MGSRGVPPCTHFFPSELSCSPAFCLASRSASRIGKSCGPMGSCTTSRHFTPLGNTGLGVRFIGRKMLCSCSFSSDLLGVKTAPGVRIASRKRTSLSSWDEPFTNFPGRWPSVCLTTSRKSLWTKRQVSSYHMKGCAGSSVHQLSNVGSRSWAPGRSPFLPNVDRCFVEPEVNKIMKRNWPAKSGSPSCAFLAACTRSSPPSSKPQTPSYGPFSLKCFLSLANESSMPSQDSH